MYLSDLLRGLRRRWYVIVGGLLLSALAALAVFNAVPARYETGATMMLLPPDETLETESANPYLVLGGMGQALAVLATRLDAPDTREDLAGTATDLAYDVVADTTTGAPFLLITTSADVASRALDLRDDIEAVAEAELSAMQRELSIGGESEIGIMTVTADREAAAVTTTRTQLTVAALAVGVIATIAFAAALDGLLAARARRRTSAASQPVRERGQKEPVLARDVLGPSRYRAPALEPGDDDDDDENTLVTLSFHRRADHASANTPTGR